jgi:hypothetical protein
MVVCPQYPPSGPTCGSFFNRFQHRAPSAYLSTWILEDDLLPEDFPVLVALEKC